MSWFTISSQQYPDWNQAVVRMVWRNPFAMAEHVRSPPEMTKGLLGTLSHQKCFIVVDYSSIILTFPPLQISS